MALGENVWERVSGRQWKGRGIDERISPRTGASERITLAHCAGVGRGVVVVPVRCQESLRYVLLTVSARVRLRFRVWIFCIGPMYWIYGWGRSKESIPGSSHWWWRFDEEVFLGRLWMFLSWGGGGGEEELQGACCWEVFAGRGGSKQPCLCYILYVEQWRFRCSMSSDHRERGFLDTRTPWADACDVSGFDNPSTCSHSDDSGGSAAFVPPRTPRSSGYDFLCTCGLCCYFLVRRTGYVRERHAP